MCGFIQLENEGESGRKEITSARDRDLYDYVCDRNHAAERERIWSSRKAPNLPPIYVYAYPYLTPPLSGNRGPASAGSSAAAVAVHWGISLSLYI